MTYKKWMLKISNKKAESVIKLFQRQLYRLPLRQTSGMDKKTNFNNMKKGEKQQIKSET